ncbi:MAG: glycosyltransferase family 4 protein [Lachnospiraceae bacterium]|nr:glycosyltransferase family 4 protein [Lachnospiraceae bacterium]
MKIYIDVSMIMIGTKFTGIPRVTMELAKRFYERKFDLVLIEYDVKKDKYRIIDTEGFIEFCKDKKGSRNKLRTDRYISFDGFEKDAVFFDVDTVWKTRVRRSFLYPKLKEKEVKIIPFIHDIIGIDFPQFCQTDDVMNFVDYIGAALNFADRIAVNSNATADTIKDLAKRLGAKEPNIDVALLGGDFKKTCDKDSEENGNLSETVKKIVESGIYIYMVGTVEPRKNHKLLLDAYENILHEKINLVIVGFAGQGMEDLIGRIENNPKYQKGLWYLNGANDDELDYLYKHTFALTFPSYAEGYGLPLMEAMIRRVPIIASDTPINREVAKDRALYFEKDDWKEFSDIVLNLLNDEKAYKDLCGKTKDYVPPTWEDTASDVIKTFEAVYRGQ